MDKQMDNKVQTWGQGCAGYRIWGGITACNRE